MQMTIEMEQEKILADGKYRVAEVYHCIDQIFRDQGIKIDWDGKCRTYTDTSEQALSHFFICMDILEKSEWFMKYVSRWLLITPNTTENILEEKQKYEAKHGR